MNINFIAMGKLKESWYREACAEYLKRLGAYVTAKVIEPSPVDLPQKPSQTQIDAALRQEAAKIREQLKPGSYTIAMCIEGKQLDSPQFAQIFQRAAVQGDAAVTFFIGSSYGLADSVKQAANLRLSMSAMTFPHQLARVMLFEQIYRGYQILGGSPYHK